MSDARPTPRQASAPEPALAAAHARFARAAMFIYLGTASVGIGLLVATLANDKTHQMDEARERLSVGTQLRAQHLARHLQLLDAELTRLGLRSEVDLLDANMEPERSLLRLTHEKSAFFNVGVAILGPDGQRAWSEPQTFLAQGWTGGRALVDSLKHKRSPEVVPGAIPSADAAILYMATPIVRDGAVVGALLGAIDLVSDQTLEEAGRKEGGGALLVLGTHEGKVIYPPGRAAFSDEPGLRAALAARAPYLDQLRLAGQETVVVCAPVEGTDLSLLSLARADELFGPARRRLATRLLSGLAVASLPLVVLVVLLRNSLATFRRSEEGLLRDERLRSLGEAVDLIAHEVKNALNGLRLGLELIVRGDREIETRARRAVSGLRTEIDHLSSFTTELLGFSKGVVPRPVSLDLGDFVRRVAELAQPAADSRGILMLVPSLGTAVRVKADPSLVHVVVANLVGNALDYAGNGARAPRVVVDVAAVGGRARVRVSDNGPGVSDAIRPRLFEPFVTGRPNGVGIGLAFSRTIARAHGGDLVLAERVSETSFDFTLPLEPS